MANYVYGTYQKAGSYSFSFRSFLAYTVSQTATSYSLTLFAGIQCSSSGDVGWPGLTVAVSGTGQTAKSATATFNNSKADSSQRQTYISSFTWTWTKGESSANKTITCTMSGSNVNNSTCTYTVTVPALATYSIEYDMNGGSGSVATQTKYYGKAITLADGAGVTRTNHTLTGWNAASDGSGTHYALSGSYSDNNDLSLFAEWELNYIKPVITNPVVYRVQSTGSTTEYDEGTWLYVNFTYTGGTIDAGANHITPTCKIIINGTTVRDAALTSATGTFSADYGTYSADEAHEVEIVLYDSYDTEGTSYTASISTAKYPIDLVGDGVNVYMGIMTPAVSGTPLTIKGFNVLEDVVFVLDDTAASGTDYEILQALTDLGWTVTP